LHVCPLQYSSRTLPATQSKPSLLADKLSEVQMSYYYECLIKELGINNNISGNTIYKPTSFDKDEILANHRSFLLSGTPSFTADRIFVRWIDNSFVEQVDDPAMYLSLYGVLL
jgi:hypothetical protein